MFTRSGTRPYRRALAGLPGMGFLQAVQSETVGRCALEPGFLRYLKWVDCRNRPWPCFVFWRSAIHRRPNPPGYECVKTTRQCMTQNDKSTFYQPLSMTLVPMQDTMRHMCFGQSHGKVTAPARQTPNSGAEEGRLRCQPRKLTGPRCSRPRTWPKRFSKRQSSAFLQTPHSPRRHDPAV